MNPAFLKILVRGNKEVEPKSSVNPVPVQPQKPQAAMNVFYRDLDFEELTPKGVQIMFMSEEELKKLSVVNVKQDVSEEKRLKFNGTISDKRMYPHFGKEICPTCLLPQCNCPGHLGYISLVKPIINIWAYKYVVFILKSICLNCGSLLLNIDAVKRYSKTPNGFKKIAELSKDLLCRNQKCPIRDQPKATFFSKIGSMLKIKIENPDFSVGFITSTKILNLFKSITDEELDALGFKQGGVYNVHPKNMLITALPVVPRKHRPTSMVEGKEYPNALTTRYHNIIKVNNSLRSGNADDKHNLDNLENEVISIIHKDNDKDSSKNDTQSSIDTSKNIHDILSHKKGLIRNNAQGKRCDNTARTVIGPGGLEVPFGWLRLPAKMKKNTMEERVCSQNIQHLRDLLNKGQIVEVRFRDQKFRAAGLRKDFVLREGMVVKRQLQEGDVVFFNRNPTLYKGSFMGYLVTFEDILTIGMHSSSTSPHNADYDGDEGNIHVCSDYYSRAEILHLSGCWNHIVGSQFSRPIMGLVFNAIVGAYQMSKYGQISDSEWDYYVSKVFTKSDRLRSLADRVKTRRPQNGTQWKTGPALFSALLPVDFYYAFSGVVIEDGVLVTGNIKKKHIGPSTNSIVHRLALDYGVQTASQFLTEGQNLLDLFISRVGFTVGYRDSSMSNQSDKVAEIVEKEIVEAEKVLVNRASLVGSKIPEIQKFYTDSVLAALNNIKTIGQKIAAEALTPDNALKIMAESGTKGTETDIAQVIGTVGQQFIRGKRPALAFNRESGSEGLRFLPYYDILHEGRPEKITNRGFVKRPLGRGIRPGDMVAFMIAGRIGLLDTAFGTAITGYSQHTITEALGDTRVAYNGTICNDLGYVIQYSGGYDSYDPGEMLEVKIPGFGNIWSPVDIENIVDKLNAEID